MDSNISFFSIINADHYKDYSAINDAVQEIRKATFEYSCAVDPFMDDNEIIADVLKKRANIAAAVKRLNDLLK